MKATHDEELTRKLEMLAHGELPLDELHSVRLALRENKELVAVFERVREEDRMITESLTQCLSSEQAPASANRRSKTTCSRMLQGSAWARFLQGLGSRRLRRVAAVVLVLTALAGGGFASGFAAGSNVVGGAGVLGPGDVEAIKEMVQEYIEAARTSNLEAMYELSDLEWQREHKVGELTGSDRHIHNMKVGDVATRWGETPQTNVCLFSRAGGGMGLVFFVVWEHGRWVVNRSEQSAVEAGTRIKMQVGAQLCAELIEDKRDAFEEDGTITVPYGDLTESQREDLAWFIGIVDDSGALTDYGRRFTDLEQASIRLVKKSGDTVVIHLLSGRIDHFMAVHLDLAVHLDGEDD